MSHLSRLVAIGASATLVFGACQSSLPSPRGDPSRSARPTDATAGAFHPSFADAPCPDDVTNQVVTPATCGFLTVLEDRSKPAGRTIQLFVGRFDPPGGTTTADPVISLGALAIQDDYGGMSPAGQRTHRVAYLLDPRGIGHSKPSLDCPEVPAVGPELAGFRLRDPARRTMLLGAVAACHDRLVGQGIDLAAYDLAANASDIEDLRTALGIGSWNINTNGSANRIAFEVARRFPRGLRSLIIDSPNLPTPDFLTVGPTALDLAISRIVAACAAQPACERDFPDLGTMIRDAVTRLDANPTTFDVTGTVTSIQLGHPIRVVVDGAALLRWIRWSLGTGGGSGSAAIPATVRSVLDGRLSATDGVVISLASDVGDCLGVLAICEEPTLGAVYSIVCRDAAGEIDQSRLEASIDGRSAYADVFSPSPLLAACATWNVATTPAASVGSITGGLPTLVLRGALDPFSAPMNEVAKATAGAPDVYLIDIPNQSYNALGYTECPLAIRNAWIDAVTAPPADTSCLANIPPIELSH
jgi:pimeloyl-ACP methyl ester carboxylesterase